jgi:hypothetical protein
VSRCYFQGGYFLPAAGARPSERSPLRGRGSHCALVAGTGSSDQLRQARRRGRPRRRAGHLPRSSSPAARSRLRAAFGHVFCGLLAFARRQRIRGQCAWKQGRELHNFFRGVSRAANQMSAIWVCPAPWSHLVGVVACTGFKGSGAALPHPRPCRFFFDSINKVPIPAYHGLTRRWWCCNWLVNL